MSRPPIIEVNNLGKRYQLGVIGATTLRDSLSRTINRFRGREDASIQGEFWALKDVSFQVEPGEVLGIIGRNGAGKSTLLKVLSRITEPTEGRAVLRGRVASLLEVGTGFHPELTGRENTFLNGAILGMTHAEIVGKLDAIVDFAGISQFLDTPVKRYSSGMRVRLAFAVAAHLDPEILIIDEVLAVGDATFQQKCLGKIGEVARSGRTVLFVSHNMAAIQSFCTRVQVIDGGRQLFDGPPSEGVEQYYRSFSSEDISGRYARLRPIDHHDSAWIATAHISACDNSSAQGEFQAGTPVAIEVDVVARHPITGLQLGIGIENSRGIRVCTLHTKCDPRLEIRGSAGKYHFRCALDSPVLAPGTYHARIQLETGQELMELIESAFNFRILKSDFFQNGGKDVAGVALATQQWTYRLEENASSTGASQALSHELAATH